MKITFFRLYQETFTRKKVEFGLQRKRKYQFTVKLCPGWKKDDRLVKNSDQIILFEQISAQNTTWPLSTVI